VHHDFGFKNPITNSIVHDHHWIFPRLFMSILQRNGDEGLRQVRAMGKLQHLYFIFTIICRLDAEIDDFIHAP
jgi:hypothetical protein